MAYWGYRNEWKLSLFATASSKEKGEEGSGAPKALIRIIPPPSQQATDDCPIDRTRIEFASAEDVQRAGIRVTQVVKKSVTATLSAPGEVDYDPTRVARLSSPVPARVWRVNAEVGQRVIEGDVLVLLDAARVGEAKANLLQAVVQLNLKETQLVNARVAGEALPGRRVLEAEADRRDARIRMFNAEQDLVNLGLPIRGKDLANLREEELAEKVRFLGLPEPLVKAMNPDTASSNLLPVKAPFDGVVAERQVAPGEVVDTTKLLFVIADLSRVWVVFSVRQEDIDRLALGQAVAFQPDGHSDEEVRGEISWISTTVDEKSRMMRARAIVDNPKEHLPARTFGTAQITVRNAPDAVVVPAEAVQRERRCRFVFVRTSDRVFQVRRVQLGFSSDEVVEVLDGVQTGEFVATTGSFVLKSEILKGRLGEGD